MQTARNILLIGLFAVLAPCAVAQQNFDDVQIEVIDVAEGLHMLVGQGGNIGVSTGGDGVFVVDDQFAPLTEKILAAIGGISDAPVRFLVNTHWHFDHTGGNENMGDAGAVIVAHENVRTRMSVEGFIEAFGRQTPAAPPGALPVITFTDGLAFHWNGDDIKVVHVENAHTDGDAIIHFTGANALHMGDTYFSGMYPFIDLGSGGSIDGMIAAAETGLARADDETKIIPGHGPLSNKGELSAYRNMLHSVRIAIAEGIQNGMSKEEVVAAKPTSAFDADWGGGFMQPDVWVGILYDSLKE